MSAPLFQKFSAAVLLASLLLILVGCATTEPENSSSRPWGYRSGYDPGLPSIINEGR